MISLKAAKNISIYFFASVIKASLLLLINPFVALNMSHTDYAIFGYFRAYQTLLVPLLSLAFFQYYSKRFFEVSPPKREELLNNLLSIQFIVGLVEISLIIGMFYTFFSLTGVSFPVFPYAFILCFTIFFNNFYSFWLLELKMTRNAAKYFRISLINSMFSVFFVTLLVIVLKLGALGKLGAPLLTALFCGMTFFLRRKPRIRIHYPELKKALTFTWPLIIAGSLEFFFSGVDRTFLEKIGNNRLLGLYNIGLGISGYLLIFNRAISDTFRPDIYQAVAQRNTRRILKYVFTLNLLNIIPVVFFIIFAPFILKVLTFGKFTAAAGFARITSLKNISRSIYFTMSSLIIAFGFPKVTLINKIIGTLGSLILFKFLIDQFGYYGAAWGQVLSFVCLSIVTSVFIGYKLVKKYSRSA